MIQQDNVVIKADVANTFYTNIRNYIAPAGTINRNFLPYYSVSAPCSSNSDSAQYYITNPQAIPTEQLSSMPAPLFINNDSEITALTVYNGLLSIVQNLTRVRKVTFSWYHSIKYSSQPSPVNILQETFVKDRVSFEEVTPTPVPSNFIKTPNNSNMLKPISASPAGVVEDNVIIANNLLTFFSNLKTAWETIYNNNPVTFQYFTCHLNCHSNWASRARR